MTGTNETGAVKAKFVRGEGLPPPHLVAIGDDVANQRLLHFSGGMRGQVVLRIKKEDLEVSLAALARARVPLLVGGPSTLEFHVGDLPYCSIRWNSPNRWLLREERSGAAEWEEAAAAEEVANTGFDPLDWRWA